MIQLQGIEGFYCGCLIAEDQGCPAAEADDVRQTLNLLLDFAALRPHFNYKDGYQGQRKKAELMPS
jgi:hypothetical protein